MIDATNVGKNYGLVKALDGVTFHVPAGEVVGLLGPNGAGKTTLMKILTGYLQPDQGCATIDGFDVLAEPLEIQKRIGYLPENAPLYPELSVQAYLGMIADLRQIPKPDQPALLLEAIHATGLEDHLTRTIGQLSKGFRQRVGLAQAIVHQPKVLILDEPTVGLDPTQVVEVRRLIHRLARQSTVLLSTHILSEVEATCERVIILLNGQVRADARLADLASTANVMLLLGSGAPDAASDLGALPNVRFVESHPTPEGSEYWILSSDRVDLRSAIYELVRDRGWPLKELRRDIRTLEAVFSELATAVNEPAGGSGGAV